MSSVYFPAHVVVLFRRLFNVVSTISVSNQYVLHTKARGKADDPPRRPTGITWSALKDFGNHPSQSSLEYLTTVEWPRWMCRSHWDRGLQNLGRFHKVDSSGAARNAMDPEILLKASLNSPNWILGNWSWSRNLFSSYQPELNFPQHDGEPPPSKPPRPSPDPKKRDEPHKSPHRESIEGGGPQTSPPDAIHQLLVNPALYDPVRTPRFPIVLCHGLYGFDSRGPSSFPSMRMHYWSNVLNILRGKVGAEVIVTSVPGTGSIYTRASRLDEQLRLRARGRGINFLAHSMGGLDCRHLISHIQPREYVPLSLTSISTPHRGSPFMDWCANNIGIGKLREQEKELMDLLKRRTQRDIEEFSSDIAEEEYYAHSPVLPEYLSKPSSQPQSKSSSESSFRLSLSSLPSSFTTLLLSVVDSPAYANLTSNFLNDVFNPATPDDPSVKYWSVAGRMSESVSVWHPFWLPKMVLDGTEEKEREKLKKTWEDERGGQGQAAWGKEIPFWADESQWGNDGLVTVQSAKWGEFLGTMEGCDHWEMRGARGIEFGVDLPGIPSLGLGSFPLASSITNRRSNHTPTAQGDGWGFGDWTRFVGAWKKNKVDTEGTSISAVTSAAPSEEVVNAVPSSVPSSSSSPLLSGPPKGDTETETKTERRTRERLADDQVVKSSTDTLSAVFDWLIERVPAPILGASVLSSSGGSSKLGVAVKEPVPKDAAKLSIPLTDKEVGAAAVAYTAGGMSSRDRVDTPPPSAPPSEMKLRMEREDKGRKSKDLASKDDLDRFYVALTRKMYDEGL